MLRNMIAAGLGFVTPLVVALNVYGAVVIGTWIAKFDLPNEAYWGGFGLLFVLVIGVACVAAVVIS